MTEVGLHSAEQKFVGVDFLKQLGTAKMFQGTQRAARGYTACREQSIQGRGQGADGVGTRFYCFTNNVHSNGAQASQGNVGGNVAVFGAQDLLHRLLHIAQGFTTDEKRAGFGQVDAAFAINHAREALRHAAPDVYGKAVAGSDHVVWADRQVHGK